MSFLLCFLNLAFASFNTLEKRGDFRLINNVVKTELGIQRPIKVHDWLGGGQRIVHTGLILFVTYLHVFSPSQERLET